MNPSGNVGEIAYDARINTSKLRGDGKESDRIAKQTGDNLGTSIEKGENRASVAFTKLAKVAKYALIGGVAAGTALIASNIDNAIKRIDTLNNASRTFDNMGFKVKDVKKTMEALEKSIKGLPTPLDSAVRGLQMISATTQDIKKSQKIFTAMNDAILGFGGTAENVETAVLQLSQGFANNKIGGQEWISMMNNQMGPVLNSIAKELGVTTGQLKERLSDGSISVKKFQDTLIKLDEKGGGGMKSLQKIAKDSTSGIGTAWANMNTAITRGLANLIKAIGTTKITDVIENIGTFFENSTGSIVRFGEKVVEIGQKIGTYLAPKLQALLDRISGLLPSLNTFLNTYIKPMAQALGIALVGALGLAMDALTALLTVLRPVIDWLNRNKGVVWGVVTALGAYYAALKLIALYTAFTTFIGVASDAMVLFRAKTMAANTQMSLFKVLMGTPFVLTLTVAAALAALGLVLAAVIKVKNAVNDVNNAARAAANYNPNVNIKKTIDLLKNRIAVEKGAALRRDQQILKNIYAGKGYLGANAKGTNNWRGGPTWVGEQGPEILNLPRGSKITPSDESMKMAGGNNVNIQLHLDGIMARSRSDLRVIGKDIIESLNEALRAKGQPEIGGGML